MTDTRDSLQSVTADISAARAQLMVNGTPVEQLQLKQWQGRITALQAGAGDAQDAVRYRYVVAGGNSIANPKARRDYYRIVNTIGKPIRKEKLDEAIDKAIATQGHDMGVV